MFEMAQRLVLQRPQLDPQIIEVKSLRRVDLPDTIAEPVDIEGSQNIAVLPRRGVMPPMTPHDEGATPGIVAPAAFDVFLAGEVKQSRQLLAGVVQSYSVYGWVHGTGELPTGTRESRFLMAYSHPY